MKAKVKIAWLHSHFLLNSNGTRYVYEVIARLKTEFDITIFVEKTNNKWKEKFRQIDIEVIEVLPFSSNHFLYWLFFPLWVRQSLRTIQDRTHGFDLIITSMFPMNWISTRLSKPTIQICFEPFAFFHDFNFIKSFNRYKRLAIRLISKMYIKYDFNGSQKSERLLVPNASVGNWVKKLYSRNPSGYTNLGVDTTLFLPTIDETLKSKYQKSKILFHLTDYTAITGTDLIIRMLPHIVRKIPQLKLIIAESISESQEKNNLVKLATSLKVDSYIEFIGQLPLADLPKYYSVANVYVFSGYPECVSTATASLSILEALSCGTQVVSSTAISDEMIKEKVGYIINPHDSKKSASTIITLLNHPINPKRAHKTERKYVSDNFTWNQVSKNITDQIDVLFDIRQQGFEQVKHQDQVLGMIFRHDTPIDKIKFFTDDMNPFQIGIHNQQAGVILTPHVHILEHPLTISSIQELVYVQFGKIHVSFYTTKGQLVSDYILGTGDAVLFVSQGHGVDFVEKSRLFMVKQGPYPGTQHAKLYFKPKT